MNNQKYRRDHFVIPFAVLCLAVVSMAQAVSPPPDGGYAGFNTAEGQSALLNLTIGAANTAVGWHSLSSSTEGSYNTAVGAGTLLFNVGNQSDFAGMLNTATGTGALLFNTAGNRNTATGAFALFTNSTGGFNTAVGGNTLYSNDTGIANTAVGESALYGNIDGNANAAVGYDALYSNETGFGNVALGYYALFSNEADNNTAVGEESLGSNVQGMSNTAVGSLALSNNSTGNYNTALGANAGNHLTVGNNNIDIGYGVSGVAGESNTIRIGDNLDDTAGTSKCYIGGILNQTVSPGTAVYIGSAGRLGTVQSSRRFKKDINPMNHSSEVIFQFRPVTFRYKEEIDSAGTPQFGLIAEEVEKVNPALVMRDQEGKPQTVRYEQVNAMLLNEFLKEHETVQEQTKAIAKLNQQVATLAAKTTEQAAQIRRVSAQVVTTNLGRRQIHSSRTTANSLVREP